MVQGRGKGLLRVVEKKEKKSGGYGPEQREGMGIGGKSPWELGNRRRYSSGRKAKEPGGNVEDFLPKGEGRRIAWGDFCGGVNFS